jgi:2-dehydrotetronate isomerase
MLRFAANLSLMYPDLPFLERFGAAAADGFKGVEYLFPYAYEAQVLADVLKAHGLQQVLFNTPPAGQERRSMVAAWDRGERGTGCAPGREAEFRAGVMMALEYARALGCPRVHAMVGLRPEHVSPEQADATLISNLQWAAPLAAQAGVTLLVEPINPRNVPGFHVQRQEHAHAIVQAVGSPHVQVQMDLFHCQRVQGDLMHHISTWLPTGRVGHLQLADAPSRHEPGTGEVHWPHVLQHLEQVATQCHWDGWIGCEYNPLDATAGGTSRGLGWLKSWQR